jgi:hypothetical protein
MMAEIFAVPARGVSMDVRSLAFGLTDAVIPLPLAMLQRRTTMYG